MPLPARMILKPPTPLISRLSSSVSVKRSSGDRSMRETSISRSRSRPLRMKISVARVASGELMKIGAAGNVAGLHQQHEVNQ